MPHFTLQFDSSGPIINAIIGVSGPRVNALRQAGQPVPDTQVVRALIDTGASGTCIDPRVLQSLGVVSTGSQPVHTPSTTSGNPYQAAQFDVSIIIPSQNLNKIFHVVPVIEANLDHQGIQALIGRDILSQCLLVYDGQSGLFTLAY